MMLVLFAFSGDKVALTGSTAAIATQATHRNLINIHYIPGVFVDTPIQMGTVEVLDVEKTLVH